MFIFLFQAEEATALCHRSTKTPSLEASWNPSLENFAVFLEFFNAFEAKSSGCRLSSGTGMADMPELGCGDEVGAVTAGELLQMDVAVKKTAVFM